MPAPAHPAHPHILLAHPRIGAPRSLPPPVRQVESVEEAMAKREAEGEDPEAAPDAKPLPPEAHELAQAMVAAHYEGWIHEEIPALGGIAPAEAVKEPAGREKVEALIAQMERDSRRMSPPLDAAVIRRLSEALGLEG